MLHATSHESCETWNINNISQLCGHYDNTIGQADWPIYYYFHVSCNWIVPPHTKSWDVPRSVAISLHLLFLRSKMVYSKLNKANLIKNLIRTRHVMWIMMRFMRYHAMYCATNGIMGRARLLPGLIPDLVLNMPRCCLSIIRLCNLNVKRQMVPPLKRSDVIYKEHACLEWFSITSHDRKWTQSTGNNYRYHCRQKCPVLFWDMLCCSI